MWIENDVFREDMERICDAEYIPWLELSGKTVLITGATGLIGYYLASALNYRNIKAKDSIRILCMVRNQSKAEDIYREQIELSQGKLSIIVGTLKDMPAIQEDVDYIVHAAGPTESKYFVQHPVETASDIIGGMFSILEMAKEKKSAGIVFLSSMEVYGPVPVREKVDEYHVSYLDTMQPRNSYPCSKRLCENLCAGYWAEHGVPANSIRLTQTFGPGIQPGDQRVFAQFLEAALQGRDIVLLTEGKTSRSYLYLSDAVTAILTVLLKGERGKAYNAAAEGTYCSIREMADFVANRLSKTEIEVKVMSDDKEAKKYISETHMDLATAQLRSLGWYPVVDQWETMLRRTMYTLGG